VRVARPRVGVGVCIHASFGDVVLVGLSRSDERSDEGGSQLPYGERRIVSGISRGI